ncbi:MAG: hypothetical protein JWL77_261 [Chthonomonadaceae bacterium]|nr:hypothetical protein [Chthonomonadaceae bacterium]
MNPGKTSLILGLLALAACQRQASAQTFVTYSGTGTNGANGDALSFTGVFTILNPGTAGSQLQIKLCDLTTAVTRSDLLSGVFFNMSGVTTPTVGASSVTTALLGTPDTGQSSIVINSNGTAAASQAVNGSYVFGDFRAVSGTQFNYGVNGSGFSTTGTGPAYNFSGFTLGGGGDDYLIRPNNATAINGGSVAVIKNEVILTINGFGAGLTSTSQLTNVYFAVASGAQVVSGTTQYVTVQGTVTPEPGPIALVAGLAASGGWCLLRRRARR